MDILSKKYIENNSIPSEIKLGNINDMPVKVMQFGEGNFLRAFVDWMINKINNDGLFNGKVAVVQPLDRGLSDMINAQDGLYTLYLRGIENGQVKVSKEIITSIKECINPYSDWAKTLEYATSNDLRFVISNTTEAGIEYKDEEYTPGICQNTFPAKLCAILFERFKAFCGDEAKGLIIIPCELIDRNGDNLKNCVLKYAKAWSLGAEFEAWIENACPFMNTLVDRIVPGYPRDEIEALTAEQGYKDNVVDTGEIFHFWVIEGDKKYAEEIPFHKAGLNVLWTDNMEPYRTRKVRILNGAHTMTVLAAHLAGLETVGDCMNDEDISNFMKKGIFEEIIPTFDLPEEEKLMFAEAVLERFANPFIKHLLLSISLNSVSKFKVRVLPSVKEYIARLGKLPTRTTFALSALIRFYKGTEIENAKLLGNIDGDKYDICDKPDVLEFFAGINAKYANDNKALIHAVLSNVSFWDEDLSAIEGFEDKVLEYYEMIENNGVRESVKKL